MGDVFTLVCNFHVPLGFKVGCPPSGVGCDIALVFIILCVGLMTIFCGVTFFSGFLSTGVYFVVSQSWCSESLVLVFLRVQVSLSHLTLMFKFKFKLYTSFPSNRSLSNSRHTLVIRGRVSVVK
jgi:hypothetical protein